MLTGKYINKYYLKYAVFFIIGVIALIAVDYFQLEIPKFLGDIVDAISNEEQLNITEIVINLVIIGVGMCVGRIVWRLALLTTSKKIESSIRREMFEKS